MSNHPRRALERLLDEAPHVRLLARSLLAEEADEVVQQTWLHAIEHGGEGVGKPRSWLSRIVRNVAANMHRGRVRRQRHEAAGGAACPVPSSAELAEREEQRRRLVAAVDGLPGHLRAVVLLRFFEGLTARDIAARLGVPPTTVWNRMREAMEVLRQRLDARPGGRAAWVGPMTILAREPAPNVPPVAPAIPLWTGALTMTAKTKFAAAATAALTIAGTVLWWQTVAGEPGTTGPGSAMQRVDAATGLGAPARPAGGASGVDAAGGADRNVREAVTVAAAPTTGTVEVSVRYGSDGSAAVDTGLQLLRSGRDHRVGARRCRTDSGGIAVFDGVPPGRYLVVTELGNLDSAAEAVAGETTHVEYVIAAGMTVTGIVVDPSGAPVADAMIEVALLARADRDPFVAATTGPAGRFELRELPTATLIGARAHGYRASRLAFLTGRAGHAVDVRLELGADGGSVDGAVFDPDGRPVPDACVRIGEGRSSGITAGPGGAPPLPALVLTDAQGRFSATGLPSGPQPVEVRAADLAPWRGECDVAASRTVSLRVDLGRGAVLRGRVVGGGGEPVRGAEVEIGDWNDLAHYRAYTGADGAFELTGLPAGELTLRARHDVLGRASETVHASMHAPAHCLLRIGRGLELKGIVTDSRGEPLADATVECHASKDRAWFARARSDADGRFAIPNCPPGDRLWLLARRRGHAERRLEGVDPLGGEVAVRLEELQPATARIVGRIVDSDGIAVPNARVFGFRAEGGAGSRPARTGPDGEFELGPLVPGTFRVSVRIAGLPRYVGAPNELGPDGRADLGTIVLPAGGRARLFVNGDAEGARFRVLDDSSAVRARFEQAGEGLLSDPLVPGTYTLIASGPKIAAQSVDFVVRANETTSLRLDLGPGTVQTFEGDRILAVVRRGGRIIALDRVNGRTDLCLAPGEYTVEARRDGDPATTRAFTVRAETGPPIRLP